MQAECPAVECHTSVANACQTRPLIDPADSVDCGREANQKEHPMKPTVAARAAVLATVLATFGCAPAFAANPITLDFEGVPGFVTPIGDYYDGGVNGSGQTGPRYGVSFSESAVALSNDANFPAYFSHSPSPTTAMFAFDANAFMNVAGGFVDSLMFYYSSTASVANAVGIYSGLGGSGTLLATVSLLGNAQTGCSDSPYCRFDLASARFAGVARSVSFGAVSQDPIYDNISFTAAVPEPATWGSLAAGLVVLVGVAAARRRRSDSV